MRINYHEHAFQVSPLLKGDELDNVENSIREFQDLLESGFEGYVEATPLFLGRNLIGLSRLIKQTKLNIFPVTGFHHSGHYSENLQKDVTDKGIDFWAESLSKELSHGMAINEECYLNKSEPNRSEIKAKVFKIGLKNPIGRFEQFVLNIAQKVYLQNEIPIMVHLDGDSNLQEIAKIIIDLGIKPKNVALAHIDRQVNFKLFMDLTELGFFLGFDSFIRTNQSESNKLFEAVAKFPDHVLIGGDLARSSRYISYGGSPGIQYTGNVVVPKIRQLASEDLLKKVLEENPNRWLNS